MKVLVQKLVVSWKVFLKIEMVLLAHSIFLMNRILAYEFLKTFLRVIFSYIYSKMEFDENILVFLICLIVTACFHWSRCVFEITLQKQSLDQNSNHKGGTIKHNPRIVFQSKDNGMCWVQGCVGRATRRAYGSGIIWRVRMEQQTAASCPQKD